jgi:uncharacterized OB-fold protein
MMTTVSRTPPIVDALSAGFWRGGEHGQLLVQRCADCGTWAHPPLPICRSCHGRDLSPRPVGGEGTVWSFTVNRYRWSPELEPPYVVAEVELDEQPGLRLLTAIVDADEVAIGMRVSVRFEPAGDAWVPVFAPC